MGKHESDRISTRDPRYQGRHQVRTELVVVTDAGALERVRIRDTRHDGGAYGTLRGEVRGY